MATQDVIPTSPLLSTVPIVNEDGTPSIYFMRQWDLQNNVNFSSISYDIVAFLPDTFASLQLLAVMPFARSVNFAENFAGSVGSVVTNPTDPAAFDVQRNDESIGTISIATDGTVTFSTIGTGDEVFVSGDTISYIAQASVDVTLANVAIALKGART